MVRMALASRTCITCGGCGREASDSRHRRSSGLRAFFSERCDSLRCLFAALRHAFRLSLLADSLRSALHPRCCAGLRTNPRRWVWLVDGLHHPEVLHRVLLRLLPMRVCNPTAFLRIRLSWTSVLPFV